MNATCDILYIYIYTHTGRDAYACENARTCWCVRNIYSHENMQRSELTGWHGFGPGVARNSIVTSEMQGSCGWRREREGKGLEEDGGYVGEYVAEAGTSPGAYIYTVGPQRPPAIFHHYADTTLGLVSIYLSVSPFYPSLSRIQREKEKRGSMRVILLCLRQTDAKLALEIG